MPIIFAQAIMFIPITLVGFSNAATASGIVRAFVDHTSFWYNFVFAILIIVFTYFYTAITINPNQMAEDMKRNNGFIPGIKPGKNTAEYIDAIMSRITLPGSIFLALVAIMPAFAGIFGVKAVGSVIAGLSCNWIIIPIGMLIGYFIVMAEPAVYVLMRQVEELTDGAIPGSAMKHSLSIGVAVSVGLAMIRVLTGISIFYLLVPGYAVAIALSFFVPKLFTAIAFDSGGVASGPMATTFLLPFAMGACSAVGGNIVTDAFGVVAMVAMTPLITIQGLGLIYRLRTKHGAVAPAPAVSGDAFALDDLAIIDL